jgi:hypothetical protein
MYGNTNEPRVRYRYTVGGQEHDSEVCFARHLSGGDLRRMVRLAEETPDTVDVHYNPLAPDESFLILPSMAAHFWGLLGAAALFFVVGAAYRFRG